MPAAPSVLTQAELRALAAYVLSLGPETVTATEAESTLVVGDRPVIARGKLPPAAPDLPDRPRGLLVGTPDGLSFEYRTDDVRLIAVRQGPFADRTDWRGRGGSVLQPLGVPIHQPSGGDPGPFAVATDGRPFQARLAETFVEDGRAGLRYALRTPEDPRIFAEVEERVRGLVLPAGSGFERDLAVRGAGAYRLRVGEPGPAWIASGSNWVARRRADGVVEAIGAVGDDVLLESGTAVVPVDLGGGDVRRVVVRTLLVPAWTADVRGLWLAEMRR